jgi:phosphate transport system substrate-binding protein
MTKIYAKLWAVGMAACLATVSVTGCRTSGKSSETDSAAGTETQSTEEAREATSEASGGETSDEPAADTTAESRAATDDEVQETGAAASSVSFPKIDGYDAGHYPYIDGSTANHPLLARIYQEICGVDRETAETMVPFNLGSTGSIWREMLYNYELPYDDYPALYIVYEPPVDVKQEFENEFENYEIDPLGRDGLVFMVNAENPVESLTVDQLYGIYTGQITNWKEVGGNDEEIKPFQRNEDSGSQTLFMKLLMKGEEPMDPPKDLREDTMGGLIDSVAAFDGSGSAIGYSVYYYANLMHSNPSLKLISVDGVAPTNDSIESAEYPLTNDFYIAIRAAEPEDSPVRALRDAMLTEAGKQLLESENYVWARQGLPAKTHGTDNPFKD